MLWAVWHGPPVCHGAHSPRQAIGARTVGTVSATRQTLRHIRGRVSASWSDRWGTERRSGGSRKSRWPACATESRSSGGRRIGEENTNARPDRAGAEKPSVGTWKDLDEVRCEYKFKQADNPVDYALFANGNLRLFVEAKGDG